MIGCTRVRLAEVLIGGEHLLRLHLKKLNVHDCEAFVEFLICGWIKKVINVMQFPDMDALL